MITTSAVKNVAYETHALEYIQWYDKYPEVLENELEAIKGMTSEELNNGLEIRTGLNRLSDTFGIKESIDPSFALIEESELNENLGIKKLSKKIPYQDLQFDIVLMTTCISYFFDLNTLFNEVYRILKSDGKLIIGFIEKESLIGQLLKDNQNEQDFYEFATHHSTSKIIAKIKESGFHDFEFFQTFFNVLDESNALETGRFNSSHGSFVVVKVKK
jgi:SAM-dependent methyltransferase